MKRTKVLWFTNTSSNYKSAQNIYNGGGWISALENEMKKISNLDIGISFFSQGEPFKSIQESVSYYPISLDRSFKNRIKRFGSDKKQEKAQINALLKVITDFEPNIIHVFGSEQIFGLLSLHTKIPVIIHLQGLITPYLNAYFPPSYSFLDMALQKGYSLSKVYRNIIDYRGFIKGAKREKIIFNNCKLFMGRTIFDKQIASIYSPNSEYFYCSEMLRSVFYTTDVWKFDTLSNKIKIISTISSPLYKGADLILKTANILKKELKLDFEWLVFGVSEFKIAERITKINASEVSVQPMGIISAIDLSAELKSCNCYFHSSYIDNSPNSICEAQILGVPVIATNVGGVSSLIEHLNTGILIPANDPYSGASHIKEIFNNKVMASYIGSNARVLALERHDKRNIVNDLTTVYRNIKKDIN